MFKNQKVQAQAAVHVDRNFNGHSPVIDPPGQWQALRLQMGLQQPTMEVVRSTENHNGSRSCYDQTNHTPNVCSGIPIIEFNRIYVSVLRSTFSTGPRNNEIHQLRR